MWLRARKMRAIAFLAKRWTLSFRKDPDHLLWVHLFTMERKRICMLILQVLIPPDQIPMYVRLLCLNTNIFYFTNLWSITELCFLLYQFKKDGGVNDPSGINSTGASRGNWWQGIIVGMLSSVHNAPSNKTSLIKDLTPFLVQDRSIIDLVLKIHRMRIPVCC